MLTEKKKRQARESYHRNKHKKKDDISYRLRLLMQQAKVRAKQRNIDFDLTVDFLLSIYPEDNICPVLGIPLKFNTEDYQGSRYNSPSLDRFNNSKGYTKDNVHIISSRANLLKSNATLEEIESLYMYMKT